MVARRPTTMPSAQDQETDKVSWNGKKFQLPKRPASNPPPQEKDRYFRKTLQGIDAASDATSLTKLSVLESRFDFRNLLNEINSSLTSLRPSFVTFLSLLMLAPIRLQ
jgi:hypothetical protein